MDPYQKYFFDVNGYLVIENALTSEELTTLNAAIDENVDCIRIRPAEQSLAGGSPALTARHGRGDLSGMLMWPQPWCQPFRDLLLHESTTPTLLELLRDAFRIDHVYGIVTDQGAEGHVLHGGGTTDDLTHFYEFHHGKMRCGLTVVGWNLTDVNPGDGGFACIPGSHKAHYPTPPDVARLESRHRHGQATQRARWLRDYLHRSSHPWNATVEGRAAKAIDSLQVFSRTDGVL
jgi:ectoine hydroxylase-related dioxygenase (phytanoyl-CoA dioxygenase family)